MAYTLDADETAALRSYAIEYGPGWKEALALDWYRARASHCSDMPKRGSVLHGLRNNLGPSWLVDYRLEPAIDFPNLKRMRQGELRNMITALSLHPWNNTEEEKIRLAAAIREQRRRTYGRSNPR